MHEVGTNELPKLVSKVLNVVDTDAYLSTIFDFQISNT